jgi:hypothetical protein
MPNKKPSKKTVAKKKAATKKAPAKKKAATKTDDSPKIKKSDYGLVGLAKENGGFGKVFENLKNEFEKRLPTMDVDEHFYFHLFQEHNPFSQYVFFYVDFLELLGAPDHVVWEMRSAAFLTTYPNINKDVESFQKNYAMLKHASEEADEFTKKRLKKMSRLECLRLNEAMNCLDSSNLATVVMAVSAVEARLHALIKLKSPRIYKAEFEKATLGGLIALFRGHHQYRNKKYNKLKLILPDRHKPLMEMLNVYRIFSAHPKDEDVSDQAARAILMLSCMLLTDTELTVS